jgi:SAM-dependent methyltransferase
VQVWDERLFAGAAPFYARGRLPYPAALVDVFRALGPSGVLVDVGSGPGILALQLAGLFERVIAVEPDPDMVAHGRAAVEARGVANVEWQVATAEAMRLADASADVVTFAQSFHWTDQPRVAALVRTALRPGGHLVLVAPVARQPVPWWPPIDALVAEFLGPVRRAGSGTVPGGTFAGEEDVLRAAGFGECERHTVRGGEPIERSAEDVVAEVYSLSSSAPHLFAERLDAFDVRLRALLADAGPLTVVPPDVEVRVWTNDA